MNKTKTFLIIDDDIDDQELFYEAIFKLDKEFKCMSAYNGEEALQKLEYYLPQIPDYIFMDLNMPRLNGKQCLLQIRKIHALAAVPVIICSTSSLQKDMEETRKLGATLFMTKPGSFDKLCSAIYQVVNTDIDYLKKIYHIRIN